MAIAKSSIRYRITLLATAVVTAVLVATALGVVLIQRQQLRSNLDASLEQRADDMTEALERSSSSDVIANSNAEDRAAQLVAIDGTVLASTPNLAGAPPLASPPPDSRTQTTRTAKDLPLEDDEYRVLSRRITHRGEPAILHLAVNGDDLRDAIRGLMLAFAIVVPLVAASLATLVWHLVGRTLKPVEAIRSEVEAIGGTDLESRVSVPHDEDEIARLAVTMNDMLGRMASATEKQRRFVADASHELRSPLTRIRTELEVDLNQPDSADFPATHRKVLDETVALQRLVDDLLQLAKTDSGVSRLRREPLDLDDIVLREVRRVRAGGRVQVDISDLSAAHVDGDRDQLTRAVRNLIENAVRHATGQVTITLEENGEGATLAVADDGPGVPDHARELIFERFARADSARTADDGGTGLGLAIASEIAVRHGGSVSLDADWNGGARFLLQLPRS